MPSWANPDRPDLVAARLVSFSYSYLTNTITWFVTGFVHRSSLMYIGGGRGDYMRIYWLTRIRYFVHRSLAWSNTWCDQRLHWSSVARRSSRTCRPVIIIHRTTHSLRPRLWMHLVQEMLLPPAVLSESRKIPSQRLSWARFFNQDGHWEKSLRRWVRMSRPIGNEGGYLLRHETLIMEGHEIR